MDPVEEQPESPLLGALETIGLFAIGVGLAFVGGEFLAPAIEDGLEALGISAAAEAPEVGVVAGAVANLADQGIDALVNGGAVSLFGALTDGVVDEIGDGLLDELGVDIVRRQVGRENG